MLTGENGYLILDSIRVDLHKESWKGCLRIYLWKISNTYDIRMNQR